MDDKSKVPMIVFFMSLLFTAVLVIAKLAGSLGQNRPFVFLLAVFTMFIIVSGTAAAAKCNSSGRYAYAVVTVVAFGVAIYLFAQAARFVAM